ncbi:MAG: hypothetical protein WA183_02390 [Chthoniobacterales bacterium]
MKNKSASQPALICLFAVLTFAICSSPALAQTPTPTPTTWTNATSGDWFNGANWDNGVPTCSIDALINNGGKAEISNPNTTACAQSLALGLNLGDSGTVTVDNVTTGGSLDVPPGCGSYTQDIFPGVIAVGWRGTGTLNITNGGTVTSGWGIIAGVAGQVGTSNGSVTVDGAGSTWTISSPCGAAARLFIGGHFILGDGDDPGGIALLNVTNGGTVEVDNPANQVSVKVGPSSTLTGNGTITTNGNGSLATLTAVQGTLAPKGLNITKDLAFASSGTMLCNVTQGNADMVNVGDIAYLNGRLSVIMTGSFNNSITQYQLLKAVNGLNSTKFARVLIQYPPNPNFRAQVTYDTTHVYLNLVFTNP